MIPVLFSYDTPVTNSFASNGLGLLTDAISCLVTEERNAGYTLKMEYPAGGHLYSKLAVYNIIAVVPAMDADIQAFRINSVSKTLNGKFTVEAQHISYDLNGIPVALRASTTGIKQTLNNIKSGSMVKHSFTFKTDISNTTTVFDEFKGPTPCKTYLAGTNGSVLDVFGGEIEWDNDVVTFWKARGKDSGNNIAYGINMTGLNLTENNDLAYSGVLPFYSASDKGGDYIWYIYDYDSNTREKTVIFKPKGSYAIQNVKTLDLTSVINKKKLPKVTSAYSATSSSAYQQELAARKAKVVSYLKSIGKKELDKLTGFPTLTTSAEFVDVSKTINHEDMIGWSPIHLCDTVTVTYEPYNLSAKLKVNKTVYNVLLDRYDTVTVGEKKRKMSEAIKLLNNK